MLAAVADRQQQVVMSDDENYDFVAIDGARRA
jgi:hypothetical protein